ncbi:hypothetical protein L7F22_066224 [Adiantum nelumboides]|nr:hypothetical protein [Adiantum nelumboides]
MFLYYECRPPDDSFWSERQIQLANARKKDEIATLDPLGASVHSAAERHAKGRATSSMLKVFMASLLLQALQGELHDASTELQSNALDCCKSLYSLTLESFTVEEGCGLPGAFVRGLANIFNKADYSVCKICTAEKLSLGLSMVEESLEHVKSEDLRNGLNGAKSNEHSVEFCLLLWKTVTLNTGFQNGELNGVDALFDETVIEFSLTEAEAIIFTINQLQGASKTSHAAYLSEKRPHTSKGARYRWQRALEKITGNSWRMLRSAVEAGLLRQRYSQLYASWLLKAREGITNELNLLSFKKGFQGKNRALLSLERDLSCLEQELPPEAIVLARYLGRSKVLTDSKKHAVTAQPLGSVVWSKVIFFLSAFWQALERFLAILVRTLKSLLSVSWKFVEKLFLISGVKWILQRCRKVLSFLRWKLLSLSKAPTASHKRQPPLPTAFSEVLDRSKLLMSKITEGQTFFNSSFHVGSITFIGSEEWFIKNHGRKLFKESGFNLLDGQNLPGVCLTFGNLSMIYSLQATALGFELVCGYVQGQLVTVPVGRPDTGIDTKMRKKVAKFLQSGCAPQVCLPAYIKNQFDSCEKSLSNFLNFLEKDIVSFRGYSEKLHEINERPFIICSYESTQTCCVPPDRNIAMTMCSLAVGCINCKIDMETYGLLGLLMIPLFDTVRVNRQPIGDEAFQSKLASSTNTPAGSGWPVVYADQLRQFVSSIVFKKEIWLSVAIAGPKVKFSGFIVSLASNSNAGDGGFDFDPVLLMDVGLLEGTIWPAMVQQDTEKWEDPLEQPFYSARKRKLWLVDLTSPYIHQDKVVQGSSQHEELGNNGVISLHGSAISLHYPEKKELVRPLRVLWRFSLCRNHYFSPTGVSNIVSAAILGSCSPIQVEILFEEVERLFEVPIYL